MSAERRLSGILPIHVADDPVVLAAQLRAQLYFDKRPEMVEPMRRKLQRLTTKAPGYQESAATSRGGVQTHKGEA